MTTGQSERQKKRFLASFRMTGNITESCESVGIGSRTTIYNWQEHDDQFVAAFREAEMQSTERLETEARLRATEGSEEPVFHQGEVVGTVRKKSDVLLIFLLKARNPAKYRENIRVQGSLTGPDGGPVEVKQGFGEDAISAVIAAAEQAAVAALYGAGAAGRESSKDATE